MSDKRLNTRSLRNTQKFVCDICINGYVYINTFTLLLVHVCDTTDTPMYSSMHVDVLF